MANQYNWSIPAIEYKSNEGDLENVVILVHWRYSVTDGTLFTDTYGVQSFDAPQEESSFIPFKDLTEEIVVGWLENAIDMDSMKSDLDSKLEEIANPKILTKINPFE